MTITHLPFKHILCWSQVWNSNAVKDQFMGQVVLPGSVKDTTDPQKLQLRKQGRQMADEMPGSISLRIITSTQLTNIWPCQCPERELNCFQYWTMCSCESTWHVPSSKHRNSSGLSCFLPLFCACLYAITLSRLRWWQLCKVERWTGHYIGDWISILVSYYLNVPSFELLTF